MEKKLNYYVIGGQYTTIFYGGSETLHGARIIAGKHKEYWDNWQGWHTPKIYRAEDCHEGTNFFGDTVMTPNEYAQPILPGHTAPLGFMQED